MAVVAGGTDKLSELPPVEFFDPMRQNLIIFDDQVCEKKKDQMRIAEYFIRAQDHA
ncbi:hypothetical protein CAOG_010196 [Capsaspora owczarzaki ATCC 30864]|uniref:Uncharacterized protein n=1 Tax=Capsaspora owczarzaki (strain ATCC 30864) TaxID=595528 RepID=A0A0D2WY37_CAPO3|nr:hypothetical protein CAOG_010196 [Capsaspora owczarzaki ATCC 30864]